MSCLPDAFRDLEPYVDDWALPTRQQRYDMRLSKTIDELTDFYDAIAPRAAEAIAYLNRSDVDNLPEDATRLSHLLSSLALVAYPVSVFKQPWIPDAAPPDHVVAVSSRYT